MKVFLDRISDLLELPDPLSEGHRWIFASVHDLEALKFAPL